MIRLYLSNLLGVELTIIIIIMIAILGAIIDFFNKISSKANRSGRGLYRSQKNCVLAGVCGGIAEQFNINPSIVRLIWIFSGIGFPIYFVLWLIIPEDSM